MPPNSVTTDQISILPGEQLSTTGISSTSVIAVVHGSRGIQAVLKSEKIDSSLPSDGNDYEAPVDFMDGMTLTVNMPAYVLFSNSSNNVTVTFSALVKAPVASAKIITATVSTFKDEKINIKKGVPTERGDFKSGDPLKFTPQSPQDTTLFSSLPFTTTVGPAALPFGGKYYVQPLPGAFNVTISSAQGQVYLRFDAAKDESFTLTSKATTITAQPSTTATNASTPPGATASSASTPPGAAVSSASTPPGAGTLPKSGDGDKALNPVQAFFAWVGRFFSSR